MLEIGTSGTVRGGGGNILTYSEISSSGGWLLLDASDPERPLAVRHRCNAACDPAYTRRCAGRSRHPDPSPEVHPAHVGIVEQLLACALVPVAAEFEDVAAVGNLKCARGVLLYEHHR